MNLKTTYNRNNFISFFRDELLPEDFISTTEQIEPGFKSKYYQNVTFLGDCPSLDLNIYEIKHRSRSDARVGLSRDAFKLVSRFDKNNALILFIPKDNSNYRLSLVTIEPKLDETGTRVKHEYSNPKRFSFVLGEDAKTHTPEQYLIRLGRIYDIKDLKKRFSVEVVNKEFYNRIAEMFSKLVGGKRKKGNKTVEFERTLQLPSVHHEDNRKYKEFAVRLIGRTVFCWFLKKKKSGSGIPLVPENVLSTVALKQNPGYYHARVEPLFFEVLNTPIGDRKALYREEPYQTIPFLNGGLFEPQSDDFYYNNGPNYALKVPDEWWKDFLEILEIYNFTIDENTSIDIELSVDPEMLGRIFENLLAEINPETGETARKATGSYYTPRPIVEYMVDESLKQYLITKTGIEESRLDILLDYSMEESGLAPEEEQKVIRAFDTIKILDPACGSGAFPIGTLQKMLLILQKVDIEAEDSIRKVLEEISDPVKRKLIEAKIKAARIDEDVDFNDYARKLSIIQRSIYGIDIQPVATDISKLRFFLSMIVDEVVQDDQPNRGIEPLPNLEFKFVCANTLIPLPDETSGALFEDRDNTDNLAKIREDYFISYGKEKNLLRKEFKKVQTAMFRHMVKVTKEADGQTQSRTFLLSAWNPFENEPAPWFDAKWMFGVEGGFDIVIGNPPYVQLQKNGGYLARMYKNIGYYTFISTGDIYCLFYEKGNQLLREDGFLCYITSNKWMRAGYGEKTRSYFVSHTNPLKLIDLGPNVFDTATVDTNILLFKNRQTNEFQLEACSVKENIGKKDIKVQTYFNKYKIILNYIDSDIWSVHNPLELSIQQKIKQHGKQLKNWKSSIYRGVLTGYNEAFIIDGATKENLANSDPQNTDIIKPIIRGRDTKRYITEFNDNWFIAVHNGYKNFENKEVKRVNIDEYPSIKAFLDKYSQKLIDRKDQGDTPYNLRNCTYYDEFIKEKIIWKRIGSVMRFSYDNTGLYCLDSTCIVTGEKIKYLVGLLNSKLCLYELFQISPKTGTGDQIISVQALEPLYVYYPDTKTEKLITDIVHQILASKSKNLNTNELETQIDLIVFKLYNLSYEEIKLIDPEIEKLISQKDYESKSIEELAEYEIKL